MDIPKTLFATMVKNARMDRHWTQEELAERIDRTPAFIGHVEAPNIKKAVSLDTLFAISSVLDVPAYKFLMFDD